MIVGVARTTKSSNLADISDRIGKIEPTAARGHEADVLFAGSSDIEGAIPISATPPLTAAPLAILSKLPEPLANNVPELPTVPLMIMAKLMVVLEVGTADTRKAHAASTDSLFGSAARQPRDQVDRALVLLNTSEVSL
jgi:hypothetical protein